MNAGRRRLLYLGFGVGVLLVAIAGTQLVSTRISESPASRSEAPWDQIRQLRSEGRYGEALQAAQEMSRALARDAGAPAWQRADAARVVATLAAVASLPDSIRRALAEADRADATIHDLMIRGRYRLAVVQAQKQLAVRSQVLGEEALDVAVSLSALGDLDMVQGDFHEARAYHDRALTLRRKTLGEKHPDVAQSLESLGLAEKSLGRLDEARSCYQHSYDLRRELFGAVHPSIAAGMSRQADLLRREGRVEDAVALFRSALQMLHSTSGRDSPEAAEVLSNLGLVEYFREDYKSADRYLRRAVELGHRVSGVSLETMALSTSVYGATLWKEHKYAEAEPVQRESARAYEFLRRQGKPGRRPCHALGIYSQIALTQLERGEFDSAWTSLERSLSRSVLDGLEPPADSAAAWEVDDAPDDDRFSSLARVRSQISDQTALVGWVMSFRAGLSIWDYPIWGYVIRRQGPVHWVRIDRPAGPGGDTGMTAMYDLSVALAAEAAWPVRMPANPELAAKAARTYRELVLPLHPLLVGVTHLVVVRAFLNAGLNVETLIDPDGSFLGERYEVSYAPSATIYVWMREHRGPQHDPRTWRALAVGDPGSGSEPAAPMTTAEPASWRPPAPAPSALAARNRAGSPYTPTVRATEVVESPSLLPGSREEVRIVAALFPASTVLLGREASKRNLAFLSQRGRLGDFDLVHLALHVQYDRQRSDAFLLLFGEAGDSIRPTDGMAAERDDRIGALEILSTWKLNADLVTVSACQAGWAIAGTEALAGIGEALFRVGAHCLLVSPWDVDDTATSLLMQRFYQNLAGVYPDERHGQIGQPMSKLLALHEASNWLREYRDARGRQPFANPIYWGAFALVGDAGD